LTKFNFTFLQITSFQDLITNATFFAKPAFATLCLYDGACSLIDSQVTNHVIAKPLFLVSGVINLTASVFLVTSFCSAAPLAFTSGLIGISCRRIGLYSLRAAVQVAPLPTVSASFSSVSLVRLL